MAKIKASPKTIPPSNQLPKSSTGMYGFDEITGGGLPTGRPTLVCGSPGCGKTLFSMEFLVHGATQYNEPGVFIAFEETAEELTKNVASLGFSLDDLVARKRLALDYVQIERSEIEETGDYDLEGLFLRIGHQIDAIGAKRVVLDTIEALFSGFSNAAILRAELRRLFRWLKGKGVTAVITGERGEHSLTRQGLEEYVSDCVILLDHRVTEQISTRRLRIVKYRGARHGTNEYPFIIDETGLSVLPVTSLELNHVASTDRISSGVPDLDVMLAGKGYYRGTTIMVSGTAGTGKTSVAGHFAHATCRRGDRGLYFAFEESPAQLMRNLRSIGIDLEPWANKGLLRFHASRPTLHGLEQHLVAVHKLVKEFQPATVIIDPISNLTAIGSQTEVNSMLTRLIDYLKSQNTTSFFTALTHGGNALEATEVGISSLMDTWLLLRDIESNGERNRGIYILKSRGMAHSNQIREFLLTDQGIRLQEPYLGPSGVLFGSARIALEAQEKAAAELREQEMQRKQRALERKRHDMESKMAELRAEYDAQAEEMERLIRQDQYKEEALVEDRAAMAQARHAAGSKTGPRGRKGEPS